MPDRYIGIDIGAETLKLVELTHTGGELRWTRRAHHGHDKQPGERLLEVLGELDWGAVRGAAISGRFARLVQLPRVPAKQAQSAGYRFLHGDGPATVVSIGSHGFSVLELRPSGLEVFRENSRCSQGTGLTIEQASRLCADVTDPAALSGRCPVILKTDMTHLANKGESRARILAGLYDAVCENVQVLIKPRVSPSEVVLIGGVSRASRIHDHFRGFLSRHGMSLAPASEDALYLEALGCAVAAAARPQRVPRLLQLLAPPRPAAFEETPPLAACLDRVQSMNGRPRPVVPRSAKRVALGFDIGSTGSKAVAIDAASREVVWEGYRATNGDPVGAAQGLMQQFLEGAAGRLRLGGLGATGSGREIVGSLMKTCYGAESTFVLNEIAAHARGALSYDRRVDTIFEIGGQDAKYIRLSEGRVVDAAMNEACSAGTGSFIQEQGRRFPGIAGVVQLGETALRAGSGISLGQHCSVFMAEVIDEAVAAGAETSTVIAGIYDSVVQNYLNRVKGPRSVGNVVFCQGMPFSARALAAAVARQTGCEVIIPPSPGTVGALGIALLALEELELAELPDLEPMRFLTARVESRDGFVCRSTRGCGGAGNRCRIERLRTTVAERRQRLPRRAARRAHRRVRAQGPLPLLRHLPPRARAGPRGDTGRRPGRAQAWHRRGQRAVLRSDAAVPRPDRRPRRAAARLPVPAHAAQPAATSGRGSRRLLSHRTGEPGPAALGSGRGRWSQDALSGDRRRARRPRVADLRRELRRARGAA
jgi:predicted CoA-substrate-specific enzyme activase